MPSVAMKGGMRKKATNVPFIAPIRAPNETPITTGTITGKSIAQVPKIAFGLGLPFTSSVCANDIAIMAVAATSGPDERSMPAVRMTWVTPSAMIPMIATCRMMIWSRASLKIVPKRSCVSKRKLWLFI